MTTTDNATTSTDIPTSAREAVEGESGPTEPNEVLYHYCSADTFFSILKNRSIWLSSLSLANDTMEGRLVTRLLLEHADRRGHSPLRTIGLRHRLENLEKMVEGLAFCVSAEGDLLSQWRGYADDARGFAIGFSKPYLDLWEDTDARLSLTRVAYDLAEQRERIEQAYDQLTAPPTGGSRAENIEDRRASGNDDTPSDEAPVGSTFDNNSLESTFRVLSLSNELYTMKAAAFAEEKEWRLVRVILPDFFSEDEDHQTEFRSSGGRIVPYIPQIFPDLGLDPIVEIILGPKNPTPPVIVERFVRSCGYHNVLVRSSAATYR